MKLKKTIAMILFGAMALSSVPAVYAEQTDSVETDYVMTVNVDNVTTEFQDFGLGWVYAATSSKSKKTTVTLYCDWLAGDADCNGVIDEDETAGTFFYENSEGTEYGTKEGALHLATDGMNMVIDLNGYKIDRGLSEGVANGQVIRLHNGAKMEIKDSSTAKTGTVTGGKNTLSDGCGGAVYIADDSTFILSGANICNNSAVSGGGIGMNSDGTFIMNDGNIYNNTATYGGGVGLYIPSAVFGQPDSHFKIYGGKFYNNTASEYGGGILFLTDGSHYATEFLAENISVYNNTAKRGGGVYIHISNGNHNDTSISNSQITANTAEYGGGVYLGEDAKVLFDECRIKDNRAYTKGGGVFCASDSYDAILGGVTYIYDNFVQTNSDDVTKSPSNMHLDAEECNVNNYTSNTLNAGSKIGISLGYAKDDDLISASGAEFNQYAYKYFLTDNDDYMIRYVDDGSQLELYHTKKPSLASVSLTENSTGGVVNINIEGKVVNAVVIAVGYNGKTMVDVGIKDFTKNTDSITLIGSFDRVKVMIWDSLFSGKALTGYREIP